MVLNKKEIDLIKWKLEDISCADDECIDGNDYEIYGEDDQGRDGSYTIKITDVTSEALDLIIRLENQLGQTS